MKPKLLECHINYTPAHPANIVSQDRTKTRTEKLISDDSKWEESVEGRATHEVHSNCREGGWIKSPFIRTACKIGGSELLKLKFFFFTLFSFFEFRFFTLQSDSKYRFSCCGLSLSVQLYIAVFHVRYLSLGWRCIMLPGDKNNIIIIIDDW